MITLPKDFAAGTDISWVPAMEDAGYVFQDLEGKPRDIFELLKNEYNINAIRLRCWVNPNEDPHRGRCGKEDTLKMAQRAVAQGQDVMDVFVEGEQIMANRKLICCDENNILDDADKAFDEHVGRLGEEKFAELVRNDGLYDLKAKSEF